MTNNVKALYIHIPFCERLCDYCDFTKLQYFRSFAEPYIKTLKKEIESYQISQELDTIYIGGGTPTCLEDDLFEELLSFLFAYTKGVKEYTVECNPESLSQNKLAIMKRYGVNRLSIGVESTNDMILKSINRNHTYEDVQKAILNARKMGFDNINVDLILGLPNVTKSLLKKDIVNILSLNVEHISCYSLTVHENTVFAINGISEPDGDFARDLYDLVNKELENNGYIHYEVSNWSKPGRFSQHNMTYWKDEQYYGVGLGASGYVNKCRYTNTKSINAYLEGKFIQTSEEISLSEDEEYYIMLNMRTINGISYKDYYEKFNKDFLHARGRAIDYLVTEKLITKDEIGIKPTYEGMMVLDSVVLKLLPS